MMGREFELRGLKVGGPDGGPLTTFKPVRVEVIYRPLKDVVDAGAFIIFEDLNGSAVLGMDTNDFREHVRARAGQEVRCIFDIESLPLNPGPFRLHLWLSSRADHMSWEIPRSFDVNVEETLVYGTRKLEREYHGVVAARARVRIETASMELIAQSSR
jgi:hypothetical protein